MPHIFRKDPDAKLDYVVDWSRWLAVAETITASTWTVETGLTTASPSPSFTSTAATIWLSGGTVGVVYSVTNHVTTSSGRIDDRTITVYVTQR